MTLRAKGPAPTPPELQILRGNPRKQAKDDDAVGDRAPKPPADAIPDPLYAFGEAGQRAWRLYWEHGRLWLAYTDVPAVSRLCRMVDEFAQITEQIDAEGLIGRSPKGVGGKTGTSRAHPMMVARQALEKRIAELEDVLHFNSSSRARAKVQATRGGGDELSGWESRRRSSAS